MIWKISLSLKLEILGVFVNTLTADDKYAVPDFKNLRFPIQMQLSCKRKFFSRIFVLFIESASSLQHFQKKEDRHS